MSRLLFAAFAVVCFLVPAYGQQTTVADHLQLAASAPNQAPTPVIGKIKISYPAFTDVNGQFYAAASQVVTIAPDGSFSTALPASDTSTKQGDSAPGGLDYSVTYYAASSGVVVSTDQWFVRASATPLTIAQVTMHSANAPLSFDPSGAAAAVLASSLQKSANLSDLASIASAKTNLGLSTVASTGRFEDLVDAPQLAPVASTGKYSDLTGKPTIPTKVSDLTNDSNFLTSATVAPVAISGAYSDLTGKPTLSTVASTGSYNDLTNKPTLSFDASGAAAQVLASSLQKAANLTDLTDVSAARTALGLVPVAHTGAYADLSGKPTLSTVAGTGSYNDLTNLPTIPNKTSQLTNDSSFVKTTDLATVATTGAYADITGKPSLAAVATSGLYTDLSGRPTISTVGSTGNYADLLGKPTLSTVATTGAYADLSGKPALATVATSGLYTDLLNAPAVPTKVSDLTNDAGYVAASSLATVATTGAYADLSGKPALNFDVLGAAAAAQAASLQKTANLSDVPDKAAARTSLGLAPVASTGAYADLTGKPTLATVATSGSYSDLANQPTIPSKTSQLTNDSSFVKTTDLATVATTGVYADLTGKPTLAAVATSGLYTDLTGKPTISTAGSTGNYSDLLGKPVLSTVATSGAYADLTGKPTLSLVSSTGLYTDLIGAPTVPTKTSQLTNDAGFAVAANLATVATTGSYADLSNKPALNFDPTGTAAAVQASSLQKTANLSDVASPATARTNLGLSTAAATGSYTDLINKPAFAAVALSGSYADLLNKPTIPTKTSDLTNDAGFAVASTLSAVATSGSYADLSNKPTIPTKVSDLTNDAGYVNATTAPVVSVNGLTGAVALSFLTPGNNLSDLTNVTTAQTNLHISAVGVSGSFADLLNKPTLGSASTHPLSDFVLTSQINQANGVPGLSASSQIDPAQIPSLTLSKISDAGTAASHAASDFLLTSALGVTVAPLDGSKLIPLANIPAIPYNSLSGAPALATVATSGSYADLLNKPAGLPPIGAASGDLGGTYPAPTVTGLNGTNLANLGVGLLKINNGVPALASNSDITTALTFTPMNPANNLSELTDQSLARTHLGLGSIASMNALSFLADNGTNGIPFRISPGTTRVATGPDIVALLGYQPVDPAQLGVTIATLDGTTHKLTASQLPPVDWSDVTNAPAFVKTSDIGTTVAGLVNGIVPTANLPAAVVATATTQGIASFPTSGALVVSAGAVSVDRSQFDAAGVAAAAQTASLQKSANLSDLTDKAAARGNLQLAAVAASGSYTDLTNKPALSAVATSGAYADLTGKPTIPTATSQLTNDSNFVASTALATIATTGQYADLKNPPVIPSKTSQLANDSSFVVSSTLSAVATSGNYSDLHGTPALATVATTGSYTDLVNKPTLPTFATVATTGSYTDLINQPTLGTIASHPISDFVSSAAVGANSGIAPLDQTGHVPFLNLSVGIPGGIATLDGSSRLSQNQIPTSGIAATAIGPGTVSNAAFGYLSNVTSDIQTQLNTVIKMAPGSTAGLTFYDGTTNQLTSVGPSSTKLGVIPATLVGDGSVTNTEYGYLHGVTSSIQTQITALSTAVGLINTGSLNNPKLTTWNSALGKTSTSLQHMAVVGDSLSCCYGVTNPADVWPRRAQDALQSQFGNGGSGMLPMTQGNLISGATSAWWTYSGGTPGFPQGGIGPYQDSGINNGGAFASMITMAPGLTATTTQSYFGNQVKVWVLSSSSTAPLTVLVDGSSVGTCGTTTGGDFETPVCSFNVTAANHTVTLQAPATMQAIVYGAQILNSTGIDVINVSHVGAEASAFTANIASNLAPVDYVQSNEGGIGLVVIELGANEMLDQTSITTLTNNLTTLVNHFKAYSPAPSIVIWDFNWFVGNYTNQDAYHTAIQQFAASNGLPLVSMDQYWGQTTAQSNGLLYSDNAHMNDAGHAVAESVFMNLVDSSSGGFGTNGNQTGGSGSGSNGGVNYTVTGGSADYPGYNINTDVAKWTVGSSGSTAGNSGNLASDLWIADENSRKISFVVGQSGNVGVGLGQAGSVPEPAAALEVSDKNGTQGSVPLRITSTSTTGYDGIDFFPPGAGTGGVPQWRIAVGAYSNPTFNNSLLIYDDGANQAVRMQIDYNGNVGIGTPAESTIPYLFSVGQKSGSPSNPVFAVQSDGTVSGLQYYANSQAGVTGTVTDGSCVITVTGGLITGHTGC